MDSTKSCNCCGEIKPLEAFYRNRTKPLGREYICKVCRTMGAKVPARPKDVRRCSRCGETKPITDFHRSKGQPLGRQYRCKVCACEQARPRVREYQRTHRESLLEGKRRYYQQNRERLLAGSNEFSRGELAWFREYKAGLTCAHCGASSEGAHFHHIDPSTKVERVSQLVGVVSRDEVLAELAKCILLCPACHAKETWRMFREGTGPRRIGKATR